MGLWLVRFIVSGLEAHFPFFLLPFDFHQPLSPFIIFSPVTPLSDWAPSVSPPPFSGCFFLFIFPLFFCCFKVGCTPVPFFLFRPSPPFDPACPLPLFRPPFFSKHSVPLFTSSGCRKSFARQTFHVLLTSPRLPVCSVSGWTPFFFRMRLVLAYRPLGLLPPSLCFLWKV